MKIVAVVVGLFVSCTSILRVQGINRRKMGCNGECYHKKKRGRIINICPINLKVALLRLSNFFGNSHANWFGILIIRNLLCTHDNYALGELICPLNLYLTSNSMVN